MAELQKGPLHKHTPCNFKSPERVIQALAEVHVELVLIHPFQGRKRPGGPNTLNPDGFSGGFANAELQGHHRWKKKALLRRR